MTAIADLAHQALRFKMSAIKDIKSVKPKISDTKRDESPLLTPTRVQEARQLGEKLARLRVARQLRQADAAARAGAQPAEPAARDRPSSHRA